MDQSRYSSSSSSDSSQFSSSNPSPSNGSTVVLSIECLRGTSKADEWTGDMLQTGDIVEELRIGTMIVKSPFKNGKSGVNKILHSSYKQKETSIRVRVRRGSDELAELQACIVPGERKQYVLRAVDDPNYTVGFFDRTEGECLNLQGMAEEAARLEKYLAKKKARTAAARTGAGSSSGIPRAAPAARSRRPSSQAGPSTAEAVIPNPTPLRQVNHFPEGSNRPTEPVVSLSTDESSEREAAQLEGRRKYRHDPVNLRDVQARSGGPSRSPVSSIDIVQQYEVHAMRDRMEQQGEDWRPEFQPGQTALTPDWRIYPNSSILGVGGIKVASEAVRHYLPPADLAQFITMPHTRMEDTIHKALAEASLAARSMSLNMSFLKYENKEVKRSNDDYRTRLNAVSMEIEEARKLRGEAEALIQEQEQLARQVSELKINNNELKSEVLVRDNRIKVLESEIVKLQAEAAAKYETGLVDGRNNYVNSPEYKRVLEQTRFQGAHDFRFSTSFRNIALEPAADYLYDGFMKAIDYMEKKGHVVPGFDPIAFEEFVNAPALRPPSATSSVEYRDFPEFKTLEPEDSDNDEAGATNPERDEMPAAAEEG